jgi:hypothetical protein
MWLVSLLTLLGLAVLLLRMSPGRGRGPGGGPGGPGSPPPWLAPLLVLRNPRLHDELHASAEQKDQLTRTAQEVLEILRGDSQGLASLAPAQRQERVQQLRRQMAEQMRTRLAPILRPEQQQRLAEIHLQMRGLEAFTDPAVQSALKLTPEQTGKAVATFEAMRKEVQQLLTAAQGNRQEARPKLVALRQSYREKLTALLTDEQKTAWQALHGKPFQPRQGPAGPLAGPAQGPGGAAPQELDFDEDF